MKTTASHYAKALFEIFHTKNPVECVKTAKDFVSFVRRRGDGKKLPLIMKKLEVLRDKQAGVQEVAIASAFPLTLSLTKELELFSQTAFESQEVRLDIQTDKSLLGGVILQTENYLIDASLSGKLRKLREVLLQ